MSKVNLEVCVDKMTGEIYGSTLAAWPADDPKYVVAEEAEKIAAALIEEKPLLYACGDAKIAYLFKAEMPRKIGCILRVSGAVGFLAHGSPDFVMVLNWSAWRSMTKAQKERVVYHELKHIGIDGKGRMGLVQHDFTGFVDEWIEFQDVIRAEAPALFDRQLGLFDKNPAIGEAGNA
jgi:hypothetical protein